MSGMPRVTRVLDACEPDCNRDEVPDACELDTDHDGTPDVCDQKGDLNHDALIDLEDYTGLYACLQLRAGPGVPPLLQDCVRIFNADDDNDVDLADVQAFQRAFGPQTIP
jgi:hypothetical protein